MGTSGNAAAAAVSVAIISTLCLEFASLPRQEIITEFLCWCLILLCGTAYFAFGWRRARPKNTSKLGTIALGATLLCLSSSVQKVNWSTAPLLIPALIIIERARALLPEQEHSERFRIARGRNLIFVCLYGATTVAILSLNHPFNGFHLKVCWLFSQIVLYVGLSHRISEWNNVSSNNIEEVVQSAIELASHMLIITGPIAVIWWEGIPSVSGAGIVAILKACRWIAVLTLTFESKLFLTAWITTFTACTHAIWIYTNVLQNFVTVVAALTALYQMAIIFPQSSVGRFAMLVFCLCPLWAFALSDRDSLYAPIRTYIPSLGRSSHHPIYHLAQEAAAGFKRLDLKQSRSLTDAVAEYKRRYGRPPPPGYDKWYNFATENAVPWIDEYDFLTKSVDPYWQIKPKILRESIDHVFSLPNRPVGSLEVKGHQAHLSNAGFQHDQLLDLLQPIVKLLPDFKAALNNFDEPRIVIPYDMLNRQPPENLGLANSEAQPVNFVNLRLQNAGDTAILSCPPNSLARSPAIEKKNVDLSPVFISNLTEAQDVCSWPASALSQHGLFSSPTNLLYTHHFVPILSTAKPLCFQDIIMPSSYYFEEGIAEYNETWDPPWDQKMDVVYWRGSSTGGHWAKGSWRHGHRQRWVSFANSAEQKIRLLNETTPGQWTAYDSTMRQLKDMFKVHFSQFIQCDVEDCAAQELEFHKADRDSSADSYKSKILFNLDGNSFSGRYYRFLKSHSLVLMQAIFKEWHDDRLIPWLHYVPVSVGMEELPEITRYLLQDPEGKVVAARIAEDSRDWSRRVLRPVDMTAALFRIFLEYARLMQDDRDTLSCCD